MLSGIWWRVGGPYIRVFEREAICAALPAAQRLMLQEISTALGPDAIVLAKDTSKTDPSLCVHTEVHTIRTI